MGFLAAAGPELLEVVEDRLALVIAANTFTVLLLEVIFAAALVNASELPLLRHELFFALLGLIGLFFLLFLLQL